MESESLVQPVINNELFEAQHKVKMLEEKVALLEKTVQEKDDIILNIEFNLEEHRAWVDNWTDANGDEFTGQIFWTKRSGSLKQGYALYFEGDWNVKENMEKGE